MGQRSSLVAHNMSFVSIKSYSVLHYTKRGGLMIAAQFVLKRSPRHIQVFRTNFDKNDGRLL